MKNSITSSVLVPGETAREPWQRNADGSWSKAARTGTASGGVFAIEALALDSVPFWAVAPEDGKVDVGGVAEMKWESLGVSPGGEGRRWIHWSAGQADRRLLIASVGLGLDTTSNPEWLKPTPEAFDISPRLYPIPDNEAALWKELGRYVVAFMRGDQLVHFSVLSARELDGPAAEEIRDLITSLEAQGFISKISGVRVWTEAGAEFTKALQSSLGVKVRPEDKPAPVLPAMACEIFPPDAAQQRRLHAAGRRRTRIVMLLAAVYVVLFGAWALWLFVREARLNQQSAALERLRPEIEEVRGLQARWEALKPATDPNTYPAEVFDRIVKLLPAEGVQLNEFQMDGSKIVVGGLASSDKHATKFKNDLMNTPGVKEFNWNFPQPVNREDGRATFRTTGSMIPTGGDSHEGK